MIIHQTGKRCPIFTIKEIEHHRLESGKSKDSAIMKTLDRGRRFQEERYVSADNILTKNSNETFMIKGKCRASMKKEIRSMSVSLNKENSNVVSVSCTCPAGKSGYCNHVMALLFEIAEYSLKQLQSVPEEFACTSQSRRWGVPPSTTSTTLLASEVLVYHSGGHIFACANYDFQFF